MKQNRNEGNGKKPPWKKIIVALLGFLCLTILFPALVLLVSRLYIRFELSHFLWLYRILGGTATRTSFDSALLSTSQGVIAVRISLFNSSVTFFCLLFVIALLLWGIPVTRRIVALIAALPVLYAGSIVRFLLVFTIRDLFGPAALPVFEVTLGAVIAFIFTILAFMTFAYLLLPWNIPERTARTKAQAG